ncbi:MAG: amidohydrolase family protein [Deltaproteobacteria bacterium]|nr:amidohydrolase family protein [Deltaproteobacteria bacterium]
MFLRAAWVLPIDQPPIRDGWVEIVAGQIRSVGPTVPHVRTADVVELPAHLLLPGLVNAHTHLDLAGVTTPCSAHQGFVPWLDTVVAYRRAASTADLQHGLRRAVRELLAGGVTCVGDYIGDARWFSLLATTPFKGTAWLEVIGCTPERITEHRQAMNAALQRCAAFSAQWPHGFTPHAPYSVHRDALHALLAKRASSVPLAIHCAESPEEWEFFTTASGPLWTRMTQLGWRGTPDAHSPLHYLDSVGPLPPRTCLIHGNYLHADDIALLQQRRCTVIHCPPSHAHFGFRCFPLEALMAANIPIALGTDSHASASTIGMLAALRQVQQTYPALATAQLVRMATRGGAEALGLEKRCGSLSPGMAADLAAVRLLDPTADPYQNVLLNDTADRVWIDGEEQHAASDTP